MLTTALFPPPHIYKHMPPQEGGANILVNNHVTPTKRALMDQTAVTVSRKLPEGPVATAQGEYRRRSLMRPAQWILGRHPFMATLEQWATGVPVDCGDPWTMEAIKLAVERGPHSSALTPEARALIADEVDYQVQAGFTEIMEWTAVQKLAPRNLKVSPLAVIPQVNRRGRLLLDLSFPVHWYPSDRPKKRIRQTDGRLVQPAVNSTTTSLSPQQPVKELGQVFSRLLDFLAAVPLQEIIHLAKIDLSDGFWRMLVDADDKWHFAEPRIFCATTETGRDVIQSLLADNEDLPVHAMETFMTPAFPARRQDKNDKSVWQMTAVYVDDYILAAVEDASGTLLSRIGRAALHTIHAIFPPPDKSGHIGGKDPISQKKLEAHDARWAPEKVILGFTVDGAARTVRLPATKADAIALATRRLLAKKRVALKTFQSVVGQLRNAARILPAARSLFTPINRALRGNPDLVALGAANSELRATLLDLRALILDLGRRPTHVHELVTRPAAYYGYCDASAFGAGGVWFSGASSLRPHVWRVQWPADITKAVVSSANRDGHVTNSDLEMAAIVLHFNILETIVPSLRHQTVVLHSDNSPSVAWATTMATKSAKSEAAHRLLRGLAMRQRALEAGPLHVLHIAGKTNVLADIASPHILAACFPDARPTVQRDFDLAGAALATATVDDAARAASWRWWARYCNECRLDPWLSGCPITVQQQLFMGFAARVRTGYFGVGRQVGHQTVEKAIRHVAQARVLAGLTDPRRTSGRPDLDLAFHHLLRSYKNDDPAPRPQLALPVIAIEAAAAPGFAPDADAFAATVADLIILAFFFLLRVGEYTLPAAHVRTRTVQFRVCDIKFWDGQTILPHTSDPAVLAAATSVTLTIDNQKNGQRGQTLHHEAVPGSFCPVKAAARRVSYIIRQLQLPPYTPLSTVHRNQHVCASDILSAVRLGARRANLSACGYNLQRVGAHSLRASGAMALWLSGHSTEAIMKYGRWKSTTFLTYIHSQIAIISRGAAQKMRSPIAFHNVGG
ncbi:hypothetical protein MHU86_13597 [Fragilaria crotonensis]|nr:hypothetical protein MHU86_13597 [Fragilaria crotonensis]